MSHDKARCQILFCALCLNPKVAASQGREEEAQAERGDGMLHDYAGCQFLLCALCQGYAEGYASGKQKAHAEVRLWELGAHEPDCGCNPCLSALAVVLEFVSANSKPVTLPRPSPRGLRRAGLRSLVRLLVSRRLALMRRYQERG